MIASADCRYAIPGAASPWPAMVREPGVTRPNAAANCNGHRAAFDANALTPGADGEPPRVRRKTPSAGGVFPDAIPAPSGAGGSENGDDELFLLGERIAELAARINAAESRMMTLIADFDRRGGWKDGFASCAEWLAWRIGIKIGPARERVRTARSLEDLPQTADALREGRISYAKVRAITRVATPGSEAELLEFAHAGSAAKLEQTVRMLRTLSRDGELKAEEIRHRNRTFSVFVDGDGMYVVQGRLEPEAGAVLMRAVEAASDALFRREDGAGHARPKPKQRRADAVGLLAERALAAGFGGGGSRGESRDSRGGSRDWGDDSGVGSDAILGGDVGARNGAQIAESDVAPGPESVVTPKHEPRSAPGAEPRVQSGTRAERYQVMVHCDAATLAEEGEPGRSDLAGIRVSAETSRRMACDAAVVAMAHAKDGSVLNVGRRTRTIPPHIRRALEERDRGCRFPGCAGRFTEAHHVKHWADGGETSLGNTLLLCRRHHRAVHEGRVKVGTDREGTVLFFTATGRVLADAPERPARTDAPKRAAPPPAANATLSNGAALYRDSAIPWAIEAAAREAMEHSLER